MIILGLTFLWREIAQGYNFEQTADKNIVAMFVSSIVLFWRVFFVPFRCHEAILDVSQRVDRLGFTQHR